MKKIILMTSVILICIIMTSFKKSNPNSGEFIITVTSDKQTEFDMFQDINSGEPITRKALKTPFQLKLVVTDGKFIFKAKGMEPKLKIKFVNNNGELTADWPITVVLIDNDRLSTFGID